MPNEIPTLPPLESVHAPDTAGFTESLVQQESGGDARAYNQTSYGASNPALGKLQTLWTTANEVAKRHNVEMSATIEDYLNDPEKQDAIGKLLTGEYLQQAEDSTPENTPNRNWIILRKMAAAHYGGPGNMDLYDDPTPQYGGPSIRDYTNKIWQRYKSGGYN